MVDEGVSSYTRQENQTERKTGWEDWGDWQDNSNRELLWELVLAEGTVRNSVCEALGLGYKAVTKQHGEMWQGGGPVVSRRPARLHVAQG